MMPVALDTSKAEAGVVVPMPTLAAKLDCPVVLKVVNAPVLGTLAPMGLLSIAPPLKVVSKLPILILYVLGVVPLSTIK